MTDLPPITPEQDTAIRDAIAQYAALPLITRYAIVAEGIDAADGEPGLLTIESPDLPAWDAIGMLRSDLTAREHDFAQRWDSNP